MKGLRVLLILAILPFTASADWKFTGAETVAQVTGSDEWLQVQSSGRKNIATTSNRVGIVYERYDRQKAEIYLATRSLGRDDGQFALTTLSDVAKPHDPLIRQCDDRFVVGWVDDRGLWMRAEQGGSITEPLLVADARRGEFTFACGVNRVYAFWTEQVDGRWRLMTRTLTLSGDKPVLSNGVAVAPIEAQRLQRQPSAAVADGHVVVAWQDRSTGTSIVYAAVSTDGASFSDPVAVNETIVKSLDWGKGSSAIESVFATSADGKLVLAWLDKRSSRSGYKIYASVNRSLDKDTWKVNQKIQDEFGDFTPQWNAALSDSATDRIVAAWSDSREDSPDIWISDYEVGLWAENEPVKPAATEDSETDPSVVIDGSGSLHIVWLAAKEGAGQRIMYAHAKR